MYIINYVLFGEQYFFLTFADGQEIFFHQYTSNLNSFYYYTRFSAKFKEKVLFVTYKSKKLLISYTKH